MSEPFYSIWKYHAIAAPRLVESQEDLDALGPEWRESPQAASEYASLQAFETGAAAEVAFAEGERLAAAERAARERIEADEAELARLIAEEEAAKAAAFNADVLKKAAEPKADA